MIKINLLPIRASRKKETAKQQVIIFIISIIGVGLLALAIYFFIFLKIQSTKTEISRAETEIQARSTILKCFRWKFARNWMYLYH
jgi:type IV pilus assembly protein PilN